MKVPLTLITATVPFANCTVDMFLKVSERMILLANYSAVSF